MTPAQVRALIKHLHAPKHRSIKRSAPRKRGSGVISALADYFREPAGQAMNTLSVQGFSQYTQDTLQKFGNLAIVNWQLERTPIPGAINRLVTFIEKGKIFQEPQDTFFHLYSVLTLENGQRLVVEKNETPNIQGYDDSEAHRDQRAGAEVLNLGQPREHLTLGEAIQRVQQHMGSLFFPYDALRNNCQDFQLAFTGANGMLTPQAQAFIKQDTNKIIENMPGLMELGAKAGTTLANWFTNAREYVGLGRKKRAPRQSHISHFHF